MKVFLSWSENKSHKVALVFKEWLPSVIQSIEPYVSSEDIDKGARWSTDIAKELEDSTFGILCVTKENINAPWLIFEAGALSKTMDKSLVCPFLFDIKRSEVDGPILQFQSTIFQKSDIKKLLITLNKACGEDTITEQMLNKAFDVWYPTLEKELNKIKTEKEIKLTTKPPESNLTPEILEQILDLARSNQKLLRNPEPSIYKSIDEIKQLIQVIPMRVERHGEPKLSQSSRRLPSMLIDELLNITPEVEGYYIGLLIALSVYKEHFPWIYEMGKDLIGILKSKSLKSEKRKAADEFMQMCEFTFEHPIMREIYGRRHDIDRYLKEIPHILYNRIMEYL